MHVHTHTHMHCTQMCLHIHPCDDGSQEMTTSKKMVSGTRVSQVDAHVFHKAMHTCFTRRCTCVSQVDAHVLMNSEMGSLKGLQGDITLMYPMCVCLVCVSVRVSMCMYWFVCMHICNAYAYICVFFSPIFMHNPDAMMYVYTCVYVCIYTYVHTRGC